MTIVHYAAKVQDKRILELPEEAIQLNLKACNKVEVPVSTAPASIGPETKLLPTPGERARAFHAWAESHSHNLPLLSDEAISREAIYSERGWMAYLIYTNILLRSIQPAQPFYERTVSAAESLLNHNETLYYCGQNVREFWNVCTRPQQNNGLGMTLAQTI